MNSFSNSDVCLVCPDINRTQKTSSCNYGAYYPNYALNLIAAELRNRGIKVVVIDSYYVYLVEGHTNVGKFIRMNISKIGAKIFGISVFSQLRRQSIELAKTIKITNKLNKVVLGGPHITAMGERVLKKYHKYVDAIVIGEGEMCFASLVKLMLDGGDLKSVNGVCYFDDTTKSSICKTSVEISDLDNLVFPDYSQYLNLAKNNKMVQTVSTITSRGCPYDCAFCMNKALWKTMRYRSPINVVNEIEEMVERYNVKNIRIWDDIFGYSRKHALDILKIIVERKIKIKIGYINTRFDVVDEEFVYWYRMAGGVGIFYGLESGSEKVRKMMGKNTNENKIKEVASIHKKHGILLGCFVIIGYPGECSSDIEATYKTLRLIKPDQVVCNVAMIYPGTKLFYKAMKEGKVNWESWLKTQPDFFPYGDNIAELTAYVRKIMGEFNGNIFRTEYENVIYNYDDFTQMKLNNVGN